MTLRNSPEPTPQERSRQIVADHDFGESALPDSVPTGYKHYSTLKDLALACVDVWYAAIGSHRRPDTVAVGAIYTARILGNRRMTQDELTEMYDISNSAIREAHHEIVDLTWI